MRAAGHYYGKRNETRSLSYATLSSQDHESTPPPKSGNENESHPTLRMPGMCGESLAGKHPHPKLMFGFLDAPPRLAGLGMPSRYQRRAEAEELHDGAS